jgi:hypothetical protein
VQWTFVREDSTGFTLAVPPGFVERSSSEPSRRWDAEGDFQQSMIVGLIRGDLPLEGYRRPYQANLMLEYTECVETIAGQRVSIQSWRTPNGVFRNFQRYDRYDVFAIWVFRPGVYVYLTGGTYLRQTQDLILGAIRALKR